MSEQRHGFTQRLALACARHPWLTIGLWLVALVMAGGVYLTWGDVFTSSSKFLNEPDSEKAVRLIEEHGGGGGGSALAQTGASVQSLADGLDDARKGARQLARGSGSVSSGAKELQRGLRKLARGAGEVSSGTERARSGAQSLSDGLAGASQGAASLSSGLAEVDGATGSFSAGLQQLSQGGDRLAAAAGKVASGASDLAGGADGAAAGVGKAAASAEQIAGGAATLDQLVAAYLQAHPEVVDDPAFQQIMGLSGQLVSGTSGLSSGLQSASAGVSSVAAGAGRLASGASSLAAGARALDAGLARSASGARQLDRSMGRLASGSASLSSGIGSAASGSQELAAGSRQLAAGSGKVASGVNGAAAGAGELASGTDAVRAGASELSRGLDSASAGAGQLSDALSSAGTLNNHDSEVVVIHSDGLTVDDPAFRREVVRIRDQIDALPEADVVTVLSVFDEGLDEETRDALTSDDGHTTIMKVELAAAADEAVNHVDGVYAVVEEADAQPEFEVAVTGAASLMKDAQDLAEKDLRRGEAIGIPIALVILVVVFGALVAAGLPLVLSVFAIVVGLAHHGAHRADLRPLDLRAQHPHRDGPGRRHRLLAVHRLALPRGASRRPGRDGGDRRRVGATAVQRGLLQRHDRGARPSCGMLIVPLSIFPSLGVGAMSAVFVAVAAALTLLPAILALLGDRVDALRVPVAGAATRGGTASGGWWGRAARRIMRRPALSLVLGVVLLPRHRGPGAASMRSGGFSAAAFPTSLTSKRGLDMLKQRLRGRHRASRPAWSSTATSARPGAAALERFVEPMDDDGRFTLTGVATSADGPVARRSDGPGRRRR